MKIVLFPGVGFIENTSKYEEFLKASTKNMDAQVEVFKWEHKCEIPEINLPYKDFRKWLAEVILDFQQIVKYANEMEVPDADIYLGHSAGSILALAQTGKPCVIYGSPAVLVEFIQDDNSKNIMKSFLSDDRPVLNIVNKYDILAYPIEKNHVENYIYRGSWCSLFTYIPIFAHRDYWTNKKVIKQTASKLKEWKDFS